MVAQVKKWVVKALQYYSTKNLEKRATKNFILKMEPVLKQVAKDASEIAATQRGVFIDCGSNQGQGYDFFSKWFSPVKFDHLLIEPNPNCIKILQNKYSDKIGLGYFKLIPKAASIKNGFTRFYGLAEGNKNPVSAGGSILNIHNSAYYSVIEEEAIKIETFDFVEFVEDCSKKYSVIIMKMDIEGAEYDILEGLISKNRAGRISTLFLEFHSSYMEPIIATQYRQKEKYLLEELKRQGCSVHLWI
jgi:FkbM family methyltransferase